MLAKAIGGGGRYITNVKDYGAVGDGTTEDTIAFTNAISAAIASSTPLHIPSGIYITNNFTLSSNLTIIGEDAITTSIKRKASSAVGSFITAPNQTNIKIKNITIDGNKVNQTVYADNIFFDGCGEIILESIRLINANGQGLYLRNGVNDTNGTYSVLSKIVCDSNNYNGLAIVKDSNIAITECVFTGNTQSGLYVYGTTMPVFGSEQHILIENSVAAWNLQHGFCVVGFASGYSGYWPIYDYDSYTAWYVKLCGNKAHNNAGYGVIAQSDKTVVSHNSTVSNGTSPSTGGGICINGRDNIVSNNNISGNIWGLDCGGSKRTIFTCNNITDNTATWLNAGSTDSIISYNVMSGPEGQPVYCDGYEADGNSIGFPWISSGIVFENNSITVTDSSVQKIKFTGGVEKTIIRNNTVRGDVSPNVWQLNITDLIACNDNSGDSLGKIFTIASASNLLIPDVGDKFNITGTTTINNIKTYASSTYENKINSIKVTSGGNGYTSIPTVSFSGGGGTGAAAQAFITRDGLLAGIRITNNGSNYTSAPLVTISGGGGTGGAATAYINCLNYDGRKITLIFNSAIILSTSGNIINGTACAANTHLILIGKSGKWHISGGSGGGNLASFGIDGGAFTDTYVSTANVDGGAF